jgi:hypothetical protein
VKPAEEGVHYLWIELLAALGFEFQHGGLLCPRAPVRAHTDQGVVAVGHRKNTGEGGNVGSGQPSRVAASIPVFVVTAHDVEGSGQHTGKMGGQFGTQHRMGVHHFLFGTTEGAGFQQDVVWNLQLAQIVQIRALPKRRDLLGTQVEPLPQRCRV